MERGCRCGRRTATSVLKEGQQWATRFLMDLGANVAAQRDAAPTRCYLWAPAHPSDVGPLQALVKGSSPTVRDRGLVPILAAKKRPGSFGKVSSVVS